MKTCIIIILGLSAWVLAGGVYAEKGIGTSKIPPVVVTLHGGFISRTIDNVIRTDFHGLRMSKDIYSARLFCLKNDCQARTIRPDRAHTELPPGAHGASHASLLLNYPFRVTLSTSWGLVPAPDINLKLTLWLSMQCHFGSLRIVVRSKGIEVNPADNAVKALFAVPPFSILKDHFSNRINDVVRRRVPTEMENAFSWVNAFAAHRLPVCPQLRVEQGNMVLDFATGGQCKHGDTDRRTCPSGYSGGKHRRCVNGYWTQWSGICVDQTPDDYGGHTHEP